jgi:hypothetical protein
VQKNGFDGLRGKRTVPGQSTMLSFLSRPGPLIRGRPAWAHIESGCAGLGSSPNNGLMGLIIIGHLYV